MNALHNTWDGKHITVRSLGNGPRLGLGKIMTLNFKHE